MMSSQPRSDRAGAEPGIQDLDSFQGLAGGLGRPANAEQPAAQLLTILVPALQAERGSVLLRSDSEPGRLKSVACGHRHGGVEPFDIEDPAVEQAIKQAVEQKQPVLYTDDEGTGISRLCVPLIRGEDVLGAMYFESAPGTGFAGSDRELAAAAALSTALALPSVTGAPTPSPQPALTPVAGQNGIHGMVGDSPRLMKVLKILERVAPTHSTVLIRGESGTGKELAARAIHQASGRADGPFVAINCSTLSETLLESELFGHEKGAFTGATGRKIGKLEAANGGTLFLDEMGEIPLNVQARLLRVLQEWVFERVGGTRSIRVDLRLVAATNRDLEAAIKAGDFRQDLYYRLNVISVVMPPLRDRRDDVEPLARYFAAQQGRRLGRRVVGPSPEALDCLKSYHWPGNVRELANVIERAVVLGDGDTIQAEDLPEEILGSSTTEDSRPDYHSAIAATKKALIRDAVKRAEGDYHLAAEMLGIHINSLHRLIRSLDLKSSLVTAAKRAT